MNYETEDSIYSSTGKLGVSRRQFGRLYVNGNPFSDEQAVLERNFRRLTVIGERHERIGRAVFRGIVSDDVMSNILNSTLRQNLEVALSLREYQDSSWLIYLSWNRKGREEITSIDAMVRETDSYEATMRLPEERVSEIVGSGYSFTDRIPEGQVDNVYRLWGETFGWGLQEIENLRKRIEGSFNRSPSERSVWFTGIRDHNEIVCAAMAERLPLPGRNGNVEVIESTEWRTRQDHTEKGLMTAAVGMVNTQVLSSFRNNSVRPLIIAECNFQSRSDRVGYGSGLRIPSRSVGGNFIPQILVQNVLVRDEQPIEEGKLRDFTFMYLPSEAMQTYYEPMQIESMMRFLNVSAPIG